jgi:hypothetical protein
MDDVMRTNPMTVGSTPSLVSGALTFDANQALSFDGSTDSFTVADSTSLSITSSISCFIKVAALPGSTKTIFDKASSYRLQMNTSGQLLWRLDNGGSNVTVTTSALATGVWHHVVCILNQEYSGTAQFGYTSFGATEELLWGDYSYNKNTFNWDATGFQNLQAGLFTMPEDGIITDLQLNVKIMGGAVVPMYVIGAVYRDSSAAPSALLCQSAPVPVNDPLGEPLGAKNVDGWLTLPLSGYATAGDYWLSFIGGSSHGVLRVGYETTGGTRKTKVHALTQPPSGNPVPPPPTATAPDPFGTPGASDSRKLSIFANYTPTARTGNEGKAYVYVNGAISGTPQSYTSGIADNANAFTHATTDAAVSIDELAIWDRVLSTVEVATLYRMR